MSVFLTLAHDRIPVRTEIDYRLAGLEGCSILYILQNIKPCSRSTFLQLHNRGQQLVGQLVLGYESIYGLQRLLRNIHRSR
jgi:hypothetical protein